MTGLRALGGAWARLRALYREHLGLHPDVASAHRHERTMAALEHLGDVRVGPSFMTPGRVVAMTETAARTGATADEAIQNLASELGYRHNQEDS